MKTTHMTVNEIFKSIPCHFNKGIEKKDFDVTFSLALKSLSKL